MTGWYYLKEGMFDDSHVGPFSDEAFLQLAFDGKLNLKSKVIHPQATNNQLVFLENVPDAKRKVNDGVLQRRREAEVARREKEKLKLDRIAQKRVESGVQRHGDAPVDAEIVTGEVLATRQTPKRINPNVVVVAVFCMSPILLCGGCLTLGWATGAFDAPQSAAITKKVVAEKKKEPVTVYAAAKDLICATDRDFLDSSPLLSPANFARVDKGTEVIIVDIGGAFSGKLYYGLSAGGRGRIYVYRRQFEDYFQRTRTIDK